MNAENEKLKTATPRPIDKFVRTGPNDCRCPNCGKIGQQFNPVDRHVWTCCGVTFDTRCLWEAQCARTQAATENSKVLSGLEAAEIHGGVALTYCGVPISVDLRSASELEMARSVIQSLLARVNGLERLLAGKDALLTREREALSRINAEREQSLTEATHFRGQRDELISAIGAYQVYGDATFPEALRMAKELRHLASPPDCAHGGKEKPYPKSDFPFSSMAKDTARLIRKVTGEDTCEPLPAAKSEGLTMTYVQILERKCATLEVRATAAEEKQRMLLKRCDDRDEVIDDERQKVREWMGERDALAKRVLTLNEKIDSLAKQLVAKDAELGLLESRFVNLRALAAQIGQTAQL